MTESSIEMKDVKLDSASESAGQPEEAESQAVTLNKEKS